MPGTLDAILTAGQSPQELLARHLSGDWRTLSDDDKRANDRPGEGVPRVFDALIEGERLLSAYMLQSGVKVWVITECDRSATTLLLPSEYRAEEVAGVRIAKKTRSMFGPAGA